MKRELTNGLYGGLLCSGIAAVNAKSVWFVAGWFAIGFAVAAWRSRGQT